MGGIEAKVYVSLLPIYIWSSNLTATASKARDTRRNLSPTMPPALEDARATAASRKMEWHDEEWEDTGEFQYESFP
jgi:hypothetical protein